MKRPILAVLSVCAVLLTTLATSAVASASGRNDSGEHAYYLSLGDSLAQGVQPNATGASVVTNQGYPNQLFRIARESIDDLRLVKLGCPGESTTTMVAGGGICAYAHGNQLADAVEFLTAHRGHVAFVTLDIGANDLDACVKLTVNGPMVNFQCIAQGWVTISANVPVIIAALKAADPNTVIVAMNYFNPFLATYLQPGIGPIFYNLALQLGDHFNALLGAIYAGQSCHFDPAVGIVCVPGTGPVIPVADVATAFSTDITTMVPFSPPLPPGGTAPLNVVRICQWTWMCVPAPVGPNIHANKAGYGVIAKVFAAKLGLKLDG